MGGFANKCELCRTEGLKLFLKGGRCFSPKCPIERKGAVPRGTGRKQRRRRVSEYGFQLREKQKMKRFYGLRERQFKNYFEKARKVKGATGEALIQAVESRLDNVVYRLGFASSRAEAGQMISHGHISVNGKKVDIASYQLKPGSTINLSSKGLKIPSVQEALSRKDFLLPDWLERKAAVGRMKRLPKKEEVTVNFDEQVVVEYYSR